MDHKTKEMDVEYMKFVRIGTIYSPYKEKSDAPRQGVYSKEVMILEIDEQYQLGLTDIEKHDHLVVLYWGDRSDRNTLLAKPPGQDTATGVFSTRSPNRPNPIAMCTVKVLNVEDNRIHVVGLDALDQSPILDIKPYVPLLDEVGME